MADDEKGPPPGGYGLEPLGKEPPTPPVQPPRTGNPFRDPAPPSTGGAAQTARWGIPVISLALIGLRVCLLGIRASEPSYEPPLVTTPLPWTEPSSLLPEPQHVVMLGPLAVDDEGTAFFIKDSALYQQKKDGAPSWLASPAIGVALSGKRVFTLDFAGLGVVGDGVTTIASGDFSSMLVDGKEAFLVTEALESGEVRRFDLGASPPLVGTLVAKGDIAQLLALDASFVYFVTGSGIGRAPRRGHDKTIVDAWFENEEAGPVSALSIAKDRLVAATPTGVWEIRQDHWTPLVKATGVTSVATREKDVVFTAPGTDLVSWQILRVSRGADPVPLVKLTVEPRFTVVKGVVHYSTPEGVVRLTEP